MVRVMVRFLRQADTDGVAAAFGEQGSDAHGTLDTSVFTLACLGHSEMQRVVHILFVHGLDQETHRLHHDHRIAGFDADDHIVESLAAEDAQKFHATLDDTLGRVAIARHDTVGERAVVDTDTYGGVMFPADTDEGEQALLYLLQLLQILLIGIFQMFERAGGVYIVAGVDAYLLTVLCRHIGHLGIEMHICHQGLRITVGFQACGDVAHVLRLARSLCGEAHQFTSGIDDTFGLCHTALGVVGVDGGHRLYADGVVATYRDIAHLRHRGRPSSVISRVAHHFTQYL